MDKKRFEESRINMKYITKVIDYSPKSKTMAKKLEETINKVCDEEKLEFVSFSITNSAKAIAVFKKTE